MNIGSYNKKHDETTLNNKGNHTINSAKVAVDLTRLRAKMMWTC